MINPETAVNWILLAAAASTLAGLAMRRPTAEIAHAVSSRHRIKNQQSKIGNSPRPLDYADIQHYQKTVAALSETIRLMGAIERTIEGHGGWQGLFGGGRQEDLA